MAHDNLIEIFASKQHERKYIRRYLNLRTHLVACVLLWLISRIQYSNISIKSLDIRYLCFMNRKTIDSRNIFLNKPRKII